MKKLLFLLLPLLSYSQIEYTGISKLIPPSQDVNININNICNNCLIYQSNFLSSYDSIEQWETYQNDRFESEAMRQWKMDYLYNNINFNNEFIIDPQNLNYILWQ